MRSEHLGSQRLATSLHCLCWWGHGVGISEVTVTGAFTVGFWCWGHDVEISQDIQTGDFTAVTLWSWWWCHSIIRTHKNRSLHCGGTTNDELMMWKRARTHKQETSLLLCCGYDGGVTGLSGLYKNRSLHCSGITNDELMMLKHHMKEIRGFTIDLLFVRSWYPWIKMYFILWKLSFFLLCQSVYILRKRDGESTTVPLIFSTFHYLNSGHQWFCCFFFSFSFLF